ncbi:MAG: CopD family protein [Bacteroidota bacterium]
MNILYLKALHIIFVVTWFAGLFYIVRLFIYHAEANQKPEPERSILINHFKGAEKRLWYGITFPSMILTYIFGFWMSYEMFGFAFPGWLWLKLAFVFGLTLYHLECHIMFRNLQRDNVKYSSFRLRLWNEVATLFLFAIVFIVVLKDSGNWLWGIIGLVIFAILLLIAINIYRKRRIDKS